MEINLVMYSGSSTRNSDSVTRNLDLGTRNSGLADWNSYSATRNSDSASRNLDFGFGKWVEDKLNKAFLHFLLNLMIFQSGRTKDTEKTLKNNQIWWQKYGKIWRKSLVQLAFNPFLGWFPKPIKNIFKNYIKISLTKVNKLGIRFPRTAQKLNVKKHVTGV